MKKIVLIFILIFSFSFFYGCNKSPNVAIDQNYILLSIDCGSDGSMCQAVKFGVNSAFINKNAKSLQEELDFKNNLIKKVGELRSEFLFTFAIIYLNNPNDLFQINKGVVLSEVYYNQDEDYVGFEIFFPSQEAWAYYHNTNSGQSEEGGKANNLFYYKQTSSGQFPFSAQINSSDGQITVGEKYREKYIQASEGLSFQSILNQEYNPDFVYSYSSPFSKLKSNGDLYYRGANRNYYHVWIENYQRLNEEKRITLSITYIFKGWWIFFAILIPLLAMFIAILLIKIKEKNIL